MAVSESALLDRAHNLRRYLLGTALFFALVVVGLFLVKWFPYWQKAHVAALTHTIGASIVSGKSAAPPTIGFAAALQYSVAYFLSVWQAVVLALVLGASIQVFLPRRWLMKLFGSNSSKSVVAVSAASMAGMMCTCCAAPIVVGLRRQQATMGSALAFFLGNPVLNPATLIFIGFVLGWGFAGIRLAFGIALVALVAWVANRYSAGRVAEKDVHVFSPAAIEDPQKTFLGIAKAWLKELWIEMYTLVPGYVVIVFILGGLRAWLFPPDLTIHAAGIGAITLLAAIGTAFVIPTAGEVPIAQTLMHAGMGAGPATALLITLPAISLPSLFIVRRVFPARLLAIVFGCVFAVGILAGITAMLVFAR